MLKGRYELKSNIGAGGMGQVRLAFDPLLQREVAIKMLPVDAAPSADQIQRMQREARALARLNHNNIVRVLDFDVSEDGEPFLVMELISGSGLNSLVKRKTLEVEDALEIALQICSGMEHAHDNQLLHRDLKPSNILLVTNDVGERIVKIIDLGLAKFDSSDQKLTHTGAAIGSPYYMSPEQAQGTELDERSDIYAFGCLLFEMLTGRPPFKGSSAMETLKMQISDSAPTLSAVAPKPYDHDLEKIVATCLAKNPVDRYRSFKDVTQELANLANQDSHNPEEEHNTPSSEAEIRANLGFNRTALIAIALFCVICTSVVIVTTFFEPASVELEKQKPTKAVALTGDKLLDDMESKKRMFEFHRNNDGTDKCGIGLIAINTKDEDLKLLENHRPPISELDLSDREFDGSGLVYLRKHPIKALNMEGTELDDRGAKNIAEFKSLQRLNVGVTHNLTDKGLQIIASLPNLIALEFGSSTTTLHSFEIVGKMHNLSTITIVMTENAIPNGFGKALAELEFHQMGFKNCTLLTRENIQELSHLRYLDKLVFCQQTISKPIVEGLNSLPLAELTLTSCSNFEPGALSALKPRKKFQLHLPKSRVPEAELASLENRNRTWKVVPDKNFLQFLEKNKGNNFPVEGL